MSTAIAVDRVWKFYGDYAALRDISLAYRAGNLHSACSAATAPERQRLLRIIAGLSRAAKGQVSIYGDDVRASNTR